MMSSAVSSTSSLAGSRQSSRSTPTMGSSSVKTKPMPSAFSVSAYSSAASNDAHVSGSVDDANAPLLGVTGIFVGFPSRSSSFQQTHWSRSRKSTGSTVLSNDGVELIGNTPEGHLLSPSNKLYQNMDRSTNSVYGV